jgi:hypothetical protein
MPYPTMAERKTAADQLIARLASVLTQWRTTGVEPEVLGVLSSGERAAIFIAVKEEKRLASPLGSFLVLEDSLQKWILQERGMTTFIGTKIAGDGV